MDRSPTKNAAGTELAREAEALIRSLAGVSHASVHAGDAGIDAVHVLADDDHAASNMARHVRSALLAGLATPVLPARIHVRVREHQDDDRAPTDDDQLDRATGRAHRIRIVDDADARSARPRPGTAATGAPEPGHDTPEPDARGRDHVTGNAPRLIAVDIERPGDGRVRCRVSVTWRATVHAADAVAVDLPGAAAQAAAQATVRALAGAGITGLELNGLREVEIAGHDYVIVALRRTDSSVRIRSGSAFIRSAPERAAAEAVVDAAREVL